MPERDPDAEEPMDYSPIRGAAYRRERDELLQVLRIIEGQSHDEGTRGFARRVLATYEQPAPPALIREQETAMLRQIDVLELLDVVPGGEPSSRPRCAGRMVEAPLSGWRRAAETAHYEAEIKRLRAALVEIATAPDDFNEASLRYMADEAL